MNTESNGALYKKENMLVTILSARNKKLVGKSISEISVSKNYRMNDKQCMQGVLIYGNTHYYFHFEEYDLGNGSHKGHIIKVDSQTGTKIHLEDLDITDL